MHDNGEHYPFDAVKIDSSSFEIDEDGELLIPDGVYTADSTNDFYREI